MVYFYASSVPNWVTGKPTVPTLSRPLFKFVRRVQDEEKCVWFHPGWWTFSSLVSSGALQNCSSRILAGYLFVQFSTHHRYLFVHHVFWMIGHLFIWIWRTFTKIHAIYTSHPRRTKLQVKKNMAWTLRREMRMGWTSSNRNLFILPRIVYNIRRKNEDLLSNPWWHPSVGEECCLC